MLLSGRRDKIDLLFTDEIKSLNEGLTSSNNNTFCYLTLIFPKRFELQSFLLSLGENDTFVTENSILEGVTRSVIKMHVANFCYKFSAYALEDSDSSFVYKLISIINHIKFTTDEFFVQMIILCGTAGGSISKEHNLGKSIIVAKATKFDRGHLKLSGGKFIAEFKESLRVEASMNWSTYLQVQESLSCNYVCDIDPEAIVLRASSVDMETNEFYRVCRNLKVENYVCLRVISDLPNSSEDHNGARRTIRKRIKFGNLVGDLRCLIEENGHRLIKVPEPTTTEQNSKERLKEMQCAKMDADYPMTEAVQKYLEDNGYNDAIIHITEDIKTESAKKRTRQNKKRNIDGVSMEFNYESDN